MPKHSRFPMSSRAKHQDIHSFTIFMVNIIIDLELIDKALSLRLKLLTQQFEIFKEIESWGEVKMDQESDGMVTWEVA